MRNFTSIRVGPIFRSITCKTHGKNKMVKIKTKVKSHILLVSNLKVGPTMVGVRYGLVLIHKGPVLLSSLDFLGRHH